MKLRASFAPWALLLLMGAAPALGAPVISDFSPNAGYAGDQVTLTGSGFSSGSLTVLFWNGGPGVAGTNLFVSSDTLVKVSVPSGITTGPIGIQQGTTGSPSYSTNDFLAIGPGPYVSSFSPTFGAVGTMVVITGVHLANTTAVLFNGTNATEVTPNADGTQISTRVPAGATSGPLTISTTLGTSNTLASFTVVGAGPFITDFSPVTGDSGTPVLIDGLHFTGVTNVTFNGQPGTNLVVTSDLLIHVQAPPGVTSGPIAVNSPLGSSVTSSNFFGRPAVTSFSPANGRANTNVTVLGANFLGATALSFNGQACTNFTVVNNTNIQAAVPAGATTGLIRVVVPGGSAFSAGNFVVRPTVSGFSPGFGPIGTPVTITGANLNAGTPIARFNGVQAAAPTGVTFSQLSVQVPAGATTGPISVTTSDGSDTNANNFFLPASIAGFAPTNSGPGSSITITGQNLLGASAVSFNGAPAVSFNVTNNNTAAAIVPSNVVTGPITVATPAGLASSSGLFYGAPVINNFAPTHGLPGNSVTISGINFLGGNVLFNGSSAGISSLNNTQIVATVPSGARTGPITVTGPAGTNTSAGSFTLDYASDLQVGITSSPNPVTIGSNLLYTISIYNAGPFAAPNATLTNLLPPTAALASATISPPWLLTTNGNLLTGTASSLGVGTVTTFLLTVTPQLTGNITDTISVGSVNPDPVPANNTASITSIVEPLRLLSIRALTNGVKVSWPAALTNDVLEFRTDLSTNISWSSVTTAPAILGGLIFVTDTNLAPAKFYRLRE